MKGAWSTLALVAVAAGLGAYIYFVDAEKPATETKEKVFSVAADDVDELRITAKGETSVLRKTNGTWALVEPVATEADANEVTSLLGSLTSLEINREVDPKAANLAEFGLAAPKADISYKAKGGATGRVRLGDATPTGGDLYAVKDDGTRVFLVGTFVETNLARSPFELRDKRVLRFERDKADGLEITTASGTSTFSRTNSDWRVTAPSNARGDYGAIEGLLTRLSTTMMTGIETTDVADLKKYGLDKPAATLVVKAGSSSATIAVGTSAEGKAYARDLSRALVFTVDPSFGTELLKSGDEYRRKDLFDFRAFTAKQVTVTRGADTVVFKKVSGAATNTIDKWTVTVGGATRDVDTAKMDDLLGKLTNLRADGFVTAVPAAAGAAALKVQAEYGEANTKEEGSIARVGADVYGARPDEAGALKLPATVFDDALKALDAVLAPPAPPTAAPAAAPANGATPGKKE